MPTETSVIIPVRNGERYVADAIASALRQLGSEDEVLVVDDRSTDGTRTAIAAVTDPRLRVIDGNGKGVSAARNIGIAVARGEFIVFLDHDDLWTPGRHAALLAVLRADPSLGGAYGRYRLQYEEGSAPYAMDDLKGSFVFQIGVGLYRRSAIDRVGGFDEAMTVGEDVDYQVRLDEARVKTQICDTETMIYRRHTGNITNDPALFRMAALSILRRKIGRGSSGVSARAVDDDFAVLKQRNIDLVRETRQRVAGRGKQGKAS